MRAIFEQEGGRPSEGGGRAPGRPSTGRCPPILPNEGILSRFARWWRGRRNPRNLPVQRTSFLERFDRWLDRLVASADLTRMLGERHARYFSDLLTKFDSGDLMDALRHAIPLAKPGESEEPLRPSYDQPSPRADLNPTRRSTGGRQYVLRDDLYERLEKKYRRAHEQLLAEGRIEEAAFVLAELLGEEKAAVDLLEKHHFYQKAAELAELKELAPGLIVRLYLLAGDEARAIRIAKRASAFHDAILRLEVSDPEAARDLRIEWARVLAASGDYFGAVTAIWPLEDQREAATPLFERAIDAGGPAGARMMAMALSSIPNTFEWLGERIQRMLEEDAPETALERRTFAEGLTAGPRTTPVRRFARPVLRALYRDATANAFVANRSLVRNLTEAVADPIFQADLPPFPNPRTGPEMRYNLRPQDITIPSSLSGTVAIESAVQLPSGHLLVALGEAGALLVDRQGERLAHFEHVTTDLVLSDHGTRALAVGGAFGRRDGGAHRSRSPHLHTLGGDRPHLLRPHVRRPALVRGNDERNPRPDRRHR